MTVRRRLRVELPDEPGALARVTTLLAAHGADVVSVDIHELDAGRAIDELIVDVGDIWDPVPSTEALLESGAGVLGAD